jgi:hypothetical protein
MIGMVRVIDPMERILKYKPSSILNIFPEPHGKWNYLKYPSPEESWMEKLVDGKDRQCLRTSPLSRLNAKTEWQLR